VTADHWTFVTAAYGLTAAALVLYWRRLARKERELQTLARKSSPQHRPRA
jgi:hypothetical protein